MINKINIFLILVFLPQILNARDLNAEINSSWLLYGKEKNLTKRLDYLYSIGDKYLCLEKIGKRDSVFELAVDEASLKDSAAFKVYDQYFSVDPELLSSDIATTYGKSMLEIANDGNQNELYYKAYSALAIANVLTRHYDAAIDYANKAYYHASQTGDERIKGKSILILGYSKENNNKKIEAFRNYMDALFIGEKLND